MLLHSSNALVSFAELAAPTGIDAPVILLLTSSMAILANDPPVPFNAEIAKLAVSSTASVNVALPLMREVAVSEREEVRLPLHRGSNQFAEKSKREKTRTKRRI